MSEFKYGTPVIGDGGGRGIFREYSTYVSPSGRWADVAWSNGVHSISIARIIAMPPWLVDLMRWYDKRAGNGTRTILQAASTALEPDAAAQFARQAEKLMRTCHEARGHFPVHGPELIAVAMAFLPEPEQHEFIKAVIDIEVALAPS